MALEWRPSRAAECLDDMLADFGGTVQCDGYGAYTSYARKRRALIEKKLSDKPIDLSACWAHAKRKFNDALEECPRQARWILHQIGLMYRIERELRGTGTRTPDKWIMILNRALFNNPEFLSK